MKKPGVVLNMNTNVEDYVEPAKKQITQKFQDVQKRVGDTARDVSDATDKYVRENPWMTIGMVAVAACLLGWFLKSAKD